MSLPTVTITGTIVKDPELKAVGSNGTMVANFTIVSNNRRLNKDTQQWEDADPTFVDAVVWKTQAENVASELSKGSRVIATGVLKQENWEKDGQKRSRLKLEVSEIGASLLFAKSTSSAGSFGSSDSGPDW